MAVLIQSIESTEIHRQKETKNTNKHNYTYTYKTTKNTSDILVNGAMWAFQCFVYNTNKIPDPF